MTTQGPNNSNAVATTKMPAAKPKTTGKRRAHSTRMLSRAHPNQNVRRNVKNPTKAQNPINLNAVTPPAPPQCKWHCQTRTDSAKDNRLEYGRASAAATIEGSMPGTKCKRRAQSARAPSRAHRNHNVSGNARFQMKAQSALYSNMVARSPQPMQTTTPKTK